jgi:hypothetical protein
MEQQVLTAAPVTRLHGPRAAVGYLLALGLLSTRDVVLGPLEVTDVSRRNRVYAVACGRGRGFVLKQGRDEAGAALLHSEAGRYGLLRSHGLASLAAGYRHWDPLTGILVLDLGSCTLSDWIRVPGRDLAHVGTLLGTALARLHGEVPAGDTAGRKDPAACWASGARPGPLHPGARPGPPHQVPWVLDLWCPPVPQAELLGPGGQALLRLLQQRRGLCRGLQDLSERYTWNDCVHGDLKADNVVLSVGAFGEPVAAQLIDWESAGPGESLWDVGSLLAEGLVARAASHVPGGPAAAGPPTAPPDLGRAVWGWNWRHAKAHPAGRPGASSLASALQFAAARCVQTAFERAQLSREAPRASIELLRTAERVMARPLAAAAKIYGLPAPAEVPVPEAGPA